MSNTAEREKTEFDISTLPEWEANYFYRKIVKMALEYFEDPEVRKRFKKWQAEKRKREAQEKERAKENEA